MPNEHATVIGMPSQNIQAEPEYLAAGDVMATVHISRRTLDRYVTAGKLPVVYLPSGHRRFQRTDVDALLTPQSSPVSTSSEVVEAGVSSSGDAA